MKLTNKLAAVLALSLLAGAASALTTTRVWVNTLTARTNGDFLVNVCLENDLTCRETNEGRIPLTLDGQAAGFKNQLAVLLTAVALDTIVTVATDLPLDDPADQPQVPFQVVLKP